MTSAASWFPGRSLMVDLTACASAFTLGYVFNRVSTAFKSAHEPTVAAALKKARNHYGYGHATGTGVVDAATATDVKKQVGRRGGGKEKGTIPDCPFQYLLNIYGRHYFARFVTAFRPTLEEDDPEKYTLLLDIMDAVHLCLILVDDICDNSTKRKNQTAAHLLYGSCETANRAYLVLTRVIVRAVTTRPVLGAEVVRALELILEGQDLSLVWRRDGLEAFDVHGEKDRVSAYKHMAQLKTGTLFVLLGRLLNDGGDELDDLLARFGWYAQLQNDCKNIYSDEYATNKGAIAEDLRNGELSFPVVVALNDKSTSSQMHRALQSHEERDIFKALEGLQSSGVKNRCIKTMQEAGQGLEKLLAIWGRHEKM
uniref:Prenyl transferase n=1 Tax=Aciculosporium take TaxID=42363 RepID=J7FJ47_9HYPO|nr:prenyl transferase [Aciculosporium take]